VCRRSGAVRWYDVDIGNFLMQCPLSEISVLYLDPPWAVGPDPSVVSPNDEIREFLWQNVFRFRTPAVICLKLPRRVEDVAEWPGEGFECVAEMNLRRKYFVYILKRADV